MVPAGLWATSALAVVLGACVGSFLNVVVWRLPRGESLLHTSSHCPRCGTVLAWKHNVPLLGWLLLRGRCAHCHWAIPLRYPAVEALTAGLWVTAIPALPTDPAPSLLPGSAWWLPLAAGWLLASWLLAIALIDVDHLWLPEPLCRWGVVAGLLTTVLLAPGDAVAATLLAHLLASCLALLGLEGLSTLGERLLGQPALGLGDAKLAALLGAWLGPAGVAAAIALAVLSGAVFGFLARLSGVLGPRQPFSFGPFLALGGWMVWLMGGEWWWQRWLEWPGLFAR